MSTCKDTTAPHGDPVAGCGRALLDVIYKDKKGVRRVAVICTHCDSYGHWPGKRKK